MELAWEVSLVVFGAIGILATLLPRRLHVTALGLEVVARVPLGIAALVYALAVLEFRGLSARFSILTYLGISLLMLVGSAQIVRWLRAQRRAVDRALGGAP